MASVEPVGWVLIVAALAAAGGTLSLVWYLDRHRDAPGATWFMAALTDQVVWIFAYTGGHFIDAPFWRAAVEAVSWIAVVWLGPLFLAFALAYTGRVRLVRSRWFLAVVAPPALTSLLAVTYPFHSLLWQEFQLVSTFGLVVAQYTIQPWTYVAAVVSLATAGAGVLVLVETVVSYGPLYRNEAIAVTVSTVPPAGAFVLWLIGASPIPSFNLAGVLFLPHVLLDAYAFVGTNMFETNPTTQRAAERGALSDLEDPLLVIDPDGRVVNMNRRAREAFGADGVVLPSSVAALVGADLTTLRDRERFEADDDTVYAVSSTPLTDPNGTAVGSLLVFYDITVVRRQQQRLSVLNRVLRHNLQNRLNVAQGYAELIESTTADSSIRSHAEAIQRANGQLLSIGQRVREFQRVQDREHTASSVDAVALAERVTTGVGETYPAGRLTVRADVENQRFETDERVVELVLRNLLENAIVHSDDEEPVAAIHVSDTEEWLRFEIRDRNEQIPDMEVETLRVDEESPLQHGQGVGLWIVTWCLEYVGGRFTFEYDDGNVVLVEVPREHS